MEHYVDSLPIPLTAKGNGRSIRDMGSGQESRYKAVLRSFDVIINDLEHYLLERYHPRN